MTRWLICCLLVGCGGAASAQDVPVVQPTRDVDVTYRVPVQPRPGQEPGVKPTSLLQRLRWSASLRRQRLDMPTSGNWMVLDFPTKRMSVVRDDARTVVEVPAPPGIDTPPAAAGFARAGTATVAGLACTEWRTRDTRGEETLACYTGDGVLLRARAGDRVLTEAVEVSYVAQGEAVFAVPAGYAKQEGRK